MAHGVEDDDLQRPRNFSSACRLCVDWRQQHARTSMRAERTMARNCPSALYLQAKMTFGERFANEMQNKIRGLAADFPRRNPKKRALNMAFLGGLGGFWRRLRQIYAFAL
jgi:hypothetical protein